MASFLSWINPFDIFIVIGLFAGIALGFIRGMVRMALNLLVLYIAVVLAMTFYDEIGYRFGLILEGRLPQSIVDTVAFVAILIITTAVLGFVLRRTYKDTELPGIRQIDQLGGMVIGFVLTCTWIGLIIIAVGFVLNATDVADVRLRANLIVFYNTSHLIPVFFKALPTVLLALKPWMPEGLPPEIFQRGFF